MVLAPSSLVKLSSLAGALLLAGMLCPASAGTKAAPKPASTKAPANAHASAKTGTTNRSKNARHGKKSRKTASWRHKGQQKIESDRTREIQEALIRENFLHGDPSGLWDQQTQSALQRYQSANGWQSKSVPDSRALIKLGLGPNHDHLLNPESAMTSSAPSRTTAQREDSATPAMVNASGNSQPQR